MTAIGISAKLMADNVNQAYLSFESSMTEVKALGGLTETEFEAMRTAALDLSTQFPIAATDVADAMYLMISVGYEYQDMMATIPDAAALATAGSMSMAEATNSLINVMGIYGDKAGSAAEISKVFANAVGVGKYEMDAFMTQTMKSIGVANQLGISFSDLASYNVALQNSFASAEEAGTSMNAMLVKITDPSTVRRLEDMGVSISNADGSFRDLTAIMTDLDVALAGVTGDAERAAIVQQLFGTYGQRAAMALMSQTDALPELKREMRDLNLIEDQTNVKLQGVAQQLEIAQNKMEAAKISLGAGMAPATIAAADAMGWFGDTLASIPAPLQAIAGTGLMAGQSLILIGPAIAGIVPLINAYQASTFAATVATQGFTAALAANPLVLAGLVVGGLALTMGTYYLSTRQAEVATKSLNQAERSAVDVKREKIREIQREIETTQAYLQHLRGLEAQAAAAAVAAGAAFSPEVNLQEIEKYQQKLEDLNKELDELEEAEFDLDLAQSQIDAESMESTLSRILGLMDEINGTGRTREELEDSEALQEIRVRTSQDDLDAAEKALTDWHAGGDNAYAMEFGAGAAREHEQELIDAVTEARVSLNRATRDYEDTLAKLGSLEEENAKKQEEVIEHVIDLNSKYDGLALTLEDVAKGYDHINEKVRDYIALTPAGIERQRQLDLLYGTGTPTTAIGDAAAQGAGEPLPATGALPLVGEEALEAEEELNEIRRIRNQLDDDATRTNEDLAEIYWQLRDHDIPEMGEMHALTFGDMIKALDQYIQRQETAIANMRSLGGGPALALPTPSEQPQASAAVGMPYIPRDMNIRVHRGEAIVPADQAVRNQTVIINNPTVRDDSDIDRITNQIFRRFQRA